MSIVGSARTTTRAAFAAAMSKFGSTPKKASVLSSLSDRPIEIVLGIDFGTSSTKRIGRLPYEVGAMAYAIPVPDEAQAEHHPYLWVTRLWHTPDGRFSLAAVVGARECRSIKAGLLSHTAAALRHEASAAELATAFLALQLREATQWLRQELQPILSRGGAIWSYNFGFPAASLDQSVLRRAYENCIAAAVALLANQDEVTLATVRATLASTALDTSALLENAHAALIPEIAAAVAGFAQSTQQENGLYALVDIGGSTVDCCTFNLFQTRQGQMRCPIFIADVEMLGMEPWLACLDERSRTAFCYQLDIMLRRTIWQTKKYRDPNSDRWKSDLPLFLIGGGALSPMYSERVHDLNRWLHNCNSGGGGVQVKMLRTIRNLDHRLCAAEQVHRLTVAHGLSLPAVDVPEVELPTEIPNVDPPSARNVEGLYIEK
jgi:hypothetical protein